MEGLKAVQEFAQQLELIPVPSVVAPFDRWPAIPTRKSVLWDTRVYAYAALMHIRIVSRGLILLSAEDNRVASAVLCRHLLEWAAHTCHVNQQLVACIAARDWPRAQTLFRDSPDLSTPIPPRSMTGTGQEPLNQALSIECSVPTLIKTYEAFQDEMYGEGHGVGVHRFLDEHASPERAAWRHHLEYWRNGEVRMGDGATVSFLPLMVWCLVDTSFFVYSLLELSGETQVRGALGHCWKGTPKAAHHMTQFHHRTRA